ncbi:putative sulfatase [Anseongella ginsenosidimutans]|uniref:Putative sulfatase n=1 Tax=Anseongella ginsenosidimutans TaxID=496056 RepID=A0A4R3KNI6_9SPHI|nr:putative sulfatase [Anseongella ginsenosidimutans]
MTIGVMALPVYLFAQPAAPPSRPNIVFILADDLGWSDIGCYGNPSISTPNLNKLAREGMLFSDAYAPAPICSPSRAAFLTGKSPARLHFEFVSKPDGSKAPAGTRLQQPAYPRDLPLEEITLAEAIDSTYATGFFGKWHLTQENDRYLGWGDTFGPLQQGFDKGSEGLGSHPYAYSKEEKKTFGNFQRGEYPEDALTGEAVAFLKSVKGRPFLLYYSMYYVHTPVQTRCRWLYDKYKKLQGAAATEKSIHYAAFVETMDGYVGQLLEALEETGQAENTVVIFTSDNGGHPSFTARGKLKGSKWNLYEGGVRVPMIVRWPGVVKPGSICRIPVTGVDVFPTICSITGAKTDPPRARDGADITPLLRDPSGAGWKREMLYWHFPYYHPDFVNTKPQSSIREGRYKLLYFYEEGRTELYDLSRDPGEGRDLSLAMPGKAARMKDSLFDELQKVKARFPLVRN